MSNRYKEHWDKVIKKKSGLHKELHLEGRIKIGTAYYRLLLRCHIVLHSQHARVRQRHGAQEIRNYLFHYRRLLSMSTGRLCEA